MSTIVHFNFGGGEEDIIVKTPYAEALQELEHAVEVGRGLVHFTGNDGKKVAVRVAAVAYLSEQS